MAKRRKPIFSINLIERRKALGFKSARAFADHIRVPYGTIRDIEAGYSDGWRETREAIAQGLGCTVDDLNRPVDPPEREDRNIKAVVKEAVRELFPKDFSFSAPAAALNPDLQKMWAHWDKTPAGLRASALYLITGDEADLRNVHKTIREELTALRKYVPKLRIPKA